MRLELVFLGKTRESFLAAGIEEYLRRLGRFVEVEARTVREKRSASMISVPKALEREGRLLLESVTRPTWLVALDRHGQSVSSTELAALLGQWEEQGRARISFVIGGPEGLAPTVLAQADWRLSLSRMTFTHEMARLLVLEQVYRAFTIRAGQKYHK